MPFVAHDAELGAIAPAQADHRTEYDCLGCDDSVTLRRSHERGEAFVAAHFWHPSSRPDDCSAESNTHIRMKSIAASKAQARWPDATVRWEGVVGDRRADVLVEFPEQDDRLGDGLAIECQHKHESKEIEAVTEDFRDAGLSVLWLYEEHYDGKDVDLDAGDWRVWWPTQVPEADEWADFHGVVHWLRQEKPSRGKIDAKFPIRSAAYRWRLQGAYKKGYEKHRQRIREQLDEAKNAVSEGGTVILPCSACKQMFEYKFGSEYSTFESLDLYITESRCPNCGTRNLLTESKININASTKGAVDERGDSGPNMVLPCPKCHTGVAFPVMLGHSAEELSPWQNISVGKTRKECSSCTSVVEIDTFNMKIRGRLLPEWAKTPSEMQDGV